MVPAMAAAIDAALPDENSSVNPRKKKNKIK